MIELTLQLATSTPLHIGGEVRHNTTATRPLLKTSNGLPYIPAPSVKGRLRHATEAFLRGQGYFVCQSPAPEYMCQSLADADGDYCPVCRLFGAPWREAPLHFSPLHLSQDDTKDFGAYVPGTTARVGIRINRKRRSVQENFLFDTELFEPGYPWRFTGHARYSGADLADLAPVLLAARMVTMMGGSRSRGLGWGKFSIALSEEPEQMLPLTALWQEWQARNG